MKIAKVFLLFLLAFACAFSACGTPNADSKEESEAEESVSGKCDYMLGKTVGELGTDVCRQMLVETALAFYYMNPNTQYNMVTELNAASRLMCLVTCDWTPEMAGDDTKFYSHCRDFVGQVYKNALNIDIPRNQGSWYSTYGDMMLLDYGTTTPGTNTKVCNTTAEFVAEMLATIQVGDVVIRKMSGGDHVMLYIGDAFGDGKNYLLHCWPLSGGSLNQTTGKNPVEPNGAIALQTVEELLLTGGSGPFCDLNSSGVVAEMLFRPLDRAKNASVVVPDSSVTRYENSHLSLQKTFSVYTSDSVIKGEEITVTQLVKSCDRFDFDNIHVEEYIPEGTVLKEGSMKVNGEAAGKVKDNTLSWNVSVKAGSEAKIEYTLVVTADAGTELTLPAGLAGHIPTRSLTVKVGACHLTAAQIEAISKVATEIPASLKTSNFMDLDFFNKFYKEIVGMDINLPKTVKDYMKGIYQSGTIPENDKVHEFKERKTIAEDFKNLAFMRVYRNAFGYYVYLPQPTTLKYHATEIEERFYTVGDLFITMANDNMNIVETTKADSLALYIYLGNGKVLEYTENGTSIKNFADTMSYYLIKNVFICLRPTQVVK